MLVKEKQFYKTFIFLALPIILQNVISLGVNLADNMMLGRYGEASLSGVTAVNQIQFIFQNLLLGVSDGLVILCTQYWGKKDTASIKKILSIAMRLGIGIMVLLFLIVSVFPGWVIGLFTNDTAIISEGVKYLSVVRFTYPFFCITYILLAFLRSMEIVKISLYLSLCTLAVNCSINWVLIYGNLGAPRLGVYGAAIGTLTARILEFIILSIFIAKKALPLKLHIKDFFVIDRQLTRDYFKVATPVLITWGLWGVNNAIQTAILGHLSSSAIAANSMASNLYLIVKTMAVGANSATAVIIGKTIGIGDEKKLRQYAKTLQLIFVVIGIISSLILFALIEPILSLYSFSDESRTLARSFLRILCIVIIGMCYQMPTNNGIIKGGGSTKYVLIMDLISIWGIVIPLSFAAAFLFNASPIVVVWCLNLDQLFKSIPAFIKCNFGHWAKKLTR